MKKRTDEDIKISVVAGLAFDSRVDSAAVKVTVKDGRVTLSGTVPTRYERMAALGQARNTTGVIDVIDELGTRETIETEGDTDSRADARLETRVYRILEGFADLMETDIVPSVEKGVVTLNGSVSELWRANQAELIVLGLREVVDVRNNLAVIPTRKISDDTLAHEITEALARHAFLDESAIQVRVEGGRVSLTGKVKSPMEADVVQAVVSTARGVSEISTQIQITGG